MKKKVLVYPCGTEIGLEIYKAVCNSIHYELYGGSSSYDHGRFVYRNHIDNLPFITDNSSLDEIEEFNRQIQKWDFDYIYPAMDGVISVFSKYRERLTPTVVGPEYATAQITRSKLKTYEVFKDHLPTPYVYAVGDTIKSFPVFIKPDVGQGSRGAALIQSEKELELLKRPNDGKIVLEYLPGEEFTIDCFTNGEGKLIYVRGRKRNRIKNGISVNAVYCEKSEFAEFAEKINNRIKQRGGWFFQLKEDIHGKLKLLEIASRIAGTSAITRNIGVNMPLLTLDICNGQKIDSVLINDYYIELDRALENSYRVKLKYRRVFVDFDDTIIVNGDINLQMVRFLYQCVNNKIEIILLTKHDGDLRTELKKYRIEQIFDNIIHIDRTENKWSFIQSENAIYIDDSYNERRMVKERWGMPVFDTHMVESLLEE